MAERGTVGTISDRARENKPENCLESKQCLILTLIGSPVKVGAAGTVCGSVVLTEFAD